MSEPASGIDEEILHNLRFDTLGDSLEVYLQILQIFLRETPQSLGGLGKAIENKDSRQTLHSAHTLRSNGLSLGASKFSYLCERIEQKAKGNITPEVSNLFAQLLIEFEVCRKIIEVESQAVSQQLSQS